MEVLKALEGGMEVPRELKGELEIGKSNEGPRGPYCPQGFARCLQRQR